MDPDIEEVDLLELCNPELEKVHLKRPVKKPDWHPKEHLKCFDKNSKWHRYDLHSIIQDKIIEQKLEGPTEIQERVFERLKIKHRDIKRDILIEAPTGSGKTLAFLIPIVNFLFKEQEHNPNHDMKTLIIVPTRELAKQIFEVLYGFVRDTPLRVGIVMGGLSMLKQKRKITKKGVDILVTTPGRLLHLTKDEESKNSLYYLLENVKFLVFDEVDKVLEATSQYDLTQIISIIKNSHTNHHRRTFVLSATIESKDRINRIFEFVPFNSQHPLYIKIGCETNIELHERLLPPNIKEYKISCLSQNRDLYLYSLLTNIKGSKIVFVNSINHIYDLLDLFSSSGISINYIHSKLKQKQRLKRLEKFKADPNGTIITSDVLGRGIDIQNVQYVIHYNIPRNRSIYVHRSGRTGRVGLPGTTISMVTPDEFSLFKRTVLVDNTKDMAKMPEFDLDLSRFDTLEEIMNIMRQLAVENKTERKRLYHERLDSKFQDTNKNVNLCMDSSTDSDDPSTAFDESQNHTIMQLKNKLSLLRKAINKQSSLG